MYHLETHSISVDVLPCYLGERSNPDMKYYFFMYSVQIKNNGSVPCRLLRRHWLIRDGRQREETVDGDGVVGEQPLLLPGETYSYRSACPLRTRTGSMRGHYIFEDELGNEFKVQIPLFFLREEDETQLNSTIC